ncbi:unnamed protein product [Paramecium octaurelia]|uniref:Uncharacterized protein n=1 Tax=Paramecium octaurelia TaxID=43137 RepID=A0A8S1YJW5_PAROT|nr:unnamed protein product [Paramecium octaurelia]
MHMMKKASIAKMIDNSDTFQNQVKLLLMENSQLNKQIVVFQYFYSYQKRQRKRSLIISHKKQENKEILNKQLNCMITFLDQQIMFETLFMVTMVHELLNNQMAIQTFQQILFNHFSKQISVEGILI